MTLYVESLTVSTTVNTGISGSHGVVNENYVIYEDIM